MMLIKYYHSFLMVLLLLCGSCNCDGCKNPYLDDDWDHTTTKKNLPAPEELTEEPEQTDEQESTTQVGEAARDTAEAELKKSKHSLPKPRLISAITDEMIQKARAGNEKQYLNWNVLANKLKDLKDGKKVEINEENAAYSNYTALHYATDLRNVEIAKILLDIGADKEAKDENGHTPLHETLYCNSIEVAKLLIANKANVNAQDKGGRTPLHVAAITCNKEMAELLIKAGANVNAKDKDDRTPLELANYLNSTSGGRASIVEFLSK